MSYKDQLNPEQKRAVEYSDGPVLIVAGAGTGKTTVITERISWLVMAKKLAPEQILALTFTEKAAAEMEERVDKILPYGYTNLWIHTFHAFAERILKEHGLDIGLTTDFKLLTQTDAWLLVNNNLDKFELDYYRPLGNPTKFLHALLKHFSKAKDEMVTPDDYLAYAENFRLDNDLRKDETAALESRRLEEIAKAYHVYQQLLLDNDYLDFGDLINYTYELFLKRPAILQKYQQQFKYILVDEFQDTNFAQYQLIKLLAAPDNNLTVVGDDDQSIYKFRGASISNILEFKKDYPESAEIYLTTNYRSKQNILDTAYTFIQLNNPNRLEVQLKAAGNKLSKELKAFQKGSGLIEYLPFQTAEEEVAGVVNKIGQLNKENPAENSWNQFAILVRANNQAQPFIEALELAGIPYQFVASKGLYVKPLILNLVAFLRLLDNYHESDAMYRYLTMPIFKIEGEEIIKITHQAYKKSWTLYEIAKQARVLLKLSASGQTELDKAVHLLEKYISQTREQKTSRIIFDFLNESGYLKYIDTLPELKKRQQFSYLAQFYKRIKTFEEVNEDKSVRNFLKQLGLELSSGEQGDLQPIAEDEGPDMVRIMTVHAAKGLEFKHVFIVNLVDRRFPSDERRDPIELPDKLVKEIIPEGNIHLEEERRLFYVGLTRAKESLFLTSAEDYGGVRKKKLSVFVCDLNLGQEKKIPDARLPKKNLESIVEIKDEIINKNKYPLPVKFSFTQLKDFQNCPRVYYYKYILKVPQKGNAFFSFGSTMHLVLQKFYEETKRRQGSAQGELFNKSRNQEIKKLIKELISLEELNKMYEQYWLDDWYQSKAQKQEYFKKGKAILKDFYESDYLNLSQPSFLEKGFSIKLNGHTLTGKIDRIDEWDGGWKIIDYKTGSPKDKLALEDKEQLLIYQMAMAALMDGEVRELAYYYLDNGGTQLSFLGTKQEIAKLQEKLIKIISDIERFDFAGYLESHEKCMYCQDII